MKNEHKSIFEIMESNESLLLNAKRILKLYTHDALVETKDFSVITIEEFMSQQFVYWKGKKNSISLKDFYASTHYYDAIDFVESHTTASDEEVAKHFLVISESILNFVNYLLVCRLDYLNGSQSSFYIETWTMLKDILNNTLQKYNYVFRFDKEKQIGIICTRKPEVESLLNEIPESITEPIIKYNHYKLDGDIESKKAILKEIGDYLEGERSDISINNDLSNKIFAFLNKLNIRHNNINPKDKSHYIAYVAAMSDQKLEECYDELYNLIILALVLDKHNKIKDKIDNLYNKLST